MRKRILAMLLAMTLLCALAVTTSAADSDFTISNGVLTKYKGSGGDVVIPAGVTSIGDYAFARCTSLTSVTIPDSVTTMEVGTFAGCTSLTSVVIPDGVTCIGWYAFQDCTSLTSVTIPDSVTSIGTDAFSSCKSLTNVTIPNSVTSMGESAFSGCRSLTSVTIPNGVTRIDFDAFASCTSLTSVTIPDSVTSIGSQAFYNCTSLTDIYYGGSEEQWNAITIEMMFNDPLQSATIHYNSAMSPWPANIAYPSTQSVEVDGVAVEFQCYALKDANGNDTNYIKLRDVASVLSGSGVQFNVGWDGAVNIETGKGYTPNGSEMKTPFSGDRAYETATAETRINGSGAALDAIVLKDDNGGAYTYYKLRDLGTALGFKVDWSADRGIFIETK